MKSAWAVLIAAAVALGTANPAPAQGYAELVARTKPAVVVIQSNAGVGTGFYISESCVLATVAHLVGRNQTIRVHGLVPSYETQVTGWDKERDVAILQGRGPCATLALADSDFVRQGEEILIIGYPALLGAQEREPSVTRGIISATRGREGLFQYDAATFSGSSGSPVINLSGRVIGMTAARLRGSSTISFGVPSNWVQALLANPVVVRSRPTFDNRIVPGERISGIALGMTLNEASAAAITTFGGMASTARQCPNVEEYRKNGLSCHIRSWPGEGNRLAAWLMFVGPPGQETVTIIGSTLVGHETAERLGRGSPLADFVRAYGEPRVGSVIRGSRGSVVAADGSPAAYWPNQGIGVFFEETSLRVWSMIVFE